MDSGFHIDFRHSAGNLHIALAGEFNGMCAWELIKTIKRQYISPGRIFVNTAGLNKVMPEGTELFKSHMTRKKMFRDWLYFKGDRGLQIAPNGSRVIICRKAPQPKTVWFQRSDNKVRTSRSLNGSLQRMDYERKQK